MFHEDGDASDGGLAGLSEDGVEGLANFGVAGEHEHEGHCDILDLLLYFGFLEGFVHEDGDEPEDEEEALDGGVVVEDLDGQGHAHDGFAGHEVGGYLCYDQFEDPFLQLQFVLVDGDKLLGFGEFPFGTQHQKLFLLVEVVVRGDVRLFLDLL